MSRFLIRPRNQLQPQRQSRRSSGMRLGSFAVLLVVAPALSQAEPTEDWSARAAAAESAENAREALRCYLAADAAAPGNPVILQKIARQYSDLADDQPTNPEKRAYAQHALDYSERAVTLAPDNAVNVLSLAISHGKLAIWSDLRAKVSYSRLVKAEAERAVALDPHYAWAYHVLGCWNYEVAQLGSTARLWLRLFYGGLPDASAAQGVRDLQRSVELDPGELAHRVALGFAYLAAGQEAAARTEFTASLAMRSHAKFDREAQERARSALARLGGAPAGGRS
jgi:tetratricopeptide (TPR) repeat protein